jgi:hypothetical protein
MMMSKQEAAAFVKAAQSEKNFFQFCLIAFSLLRSLEFLLCCC